MREGEIDLWERLRDKLGGETLARTCKSNDGKRWWGKVEGVKETEDGGKGGAGGKGGIE